ncbi:DinB family protein [Botrimarina hoheduenensis]|uniref:DinB superfamily protein n=1 Tax=Botrimarina hoheduenensis TaxID=2528000 RepID=A0A5C5VX07_9BACT|nr:DinB family protein [Botrimarina hoheduenensis]TWT42473.1 DinB superfamily protein [Botrimarina hoheduenensis]
MQTRLAPALERIRFSRQMTATFLEGLTADEWFWQPQPEMNHIGWHVGHLAFAQYFLCLKRVRDRIEADESLISTSFLKRYKRESTPSGDPAKNETPAELRRVFDGVFELSLAELTDRTDQELEVPTLPAHPVFDTKLGAIEWCSQHELMHCGQIVLLRRLMGKSPTW